MIALATFALLIISLGYDITSPDLLRFVSGSLLMLFGVFALGLAIKDFCALRASRLYVLCLGLLVFAPFDLWFYTTLTIKINVCCVEIEPPMSRPRAGSWAVFASITSNQRLENARLYVEEVSGSSLKTPIRVRRQLAWALGDQSWTAVEILPGEPFKFVPFVAWNKEKPEVGQKLQLFLQPEVDPETLETNDELGPTQHIAAGVYLVKLRLTGTFRGHAVDRFKILKLTWGGEMNNIKLDFGD